MWKSYGLFSVENPAYRDPIASPQFPCKFHSSWYSSLPMPEVYQSWKQPKISCSQQSNPHDLHQAPSVLTSTERHNVGKTQNNCFGNDRVNSFLDFIFLKALYSFLLYDYLSGHVIRSRAITRPTGKVKGRERDVSASRAVCQACRWFLRSSWER